MANGDELRLTPGPLFIHVYVVICRHKNLSTCRAVHVAFMFSHKRIYYMYTRLYEFPEAPTKMLHPLRSVLPWNLYVSVGFASCFNVLTQSS
jgi:hypothetical protein